MPTTFETKPLAEVQDLLRSLVSPYGELTERGRHKGWILTCTLASRSSVQFEFCYHEARRYVVRMRQNFRGDSRVEGFETETSLRALLEIGRQFHRIFQSDESWVAVEFPLRSQDQATDSDELLQEALLTLQEYMMGQDGSLITLRVPESVTVSLPEESDDEGD